MVPLGRSAFVEEAAQTVMTKVYPVTLDWALRSLYGYGWELERTVIHERVVYNSKFEIG